MQSKFQIIKRQLKTQEYIDVKNGTKTFDVILRLPGQQLDVGDLVTLQEVDENGSITGQEITKKISSRLDIEELDVPEYVDIDKALKNGVSVVGWVAPEQYTLKSVYDFGFTMHLAIDRIEEEDVTDEHADRKFNIVEGPFYSPPLASPEFIQYGVLDGFHINKWPIGRYSIVLMIHVGVPEGDKPVDIDTIDALILTVSKSKDVDSPALEFYDLDVRALLDGKAITTDGEKVTPATPQEIEAHIQEHLEEDPDYMDLENMSQEDMMESMLSGEHGVDFKGMDVEAIKKLMKDSEEGVIDVDTEEEDGEEEYNG